MGEKNTTLISLCMITKDEEMHLPICLQNIKDCVDEIIIVDTGSSDHTIEIVKQAGAKVYKQKWQSNFSTVRNYAIEKASGKWILFLDGDEQISREEAQQIRPLLNNPMAEGYLFDILTFQEHQEAPLRTQAVRLFRNRKEYRYQHRVFERIPEETLTNVLDAGITIIHRPDPAKKKQILALKLELVEEEIKDHPNDGYLRYAYGIELFNRQSYALCSEQLMTALPLVNPHVLYCPHLYKLLAWSLTKLNKLEEAMDVIREGIYHFPFYTDLYHLRGELYRQLKKYSEAIQDMEKCLQLGDAPASMVADPGMGSYEAFLSLGRIHEVLLNGALALRFYKQAYDTGNRLEEALYRTGALLKENPELGEIDTILIKWIDEDNPEEFMTLVDILCLEREYTKALHYTDKVETIVGAREDITFVRGICYMMLGDYQQAENQFSSIPEQHPFYPHVILRQIQNHWFHQRWAEAEILIQKIKDLPKMNENTKKIYNHCHNLLSGATNEAELLKLDEAGAQVLGKLIENLLYVKQITLARPLLDWLLASGFEYLWVKIGEMYAAYLEMDHVLQISQHIKDQNIQVDLREKTAKQFYVNGRIDLAEQMLHTGGPMEYSVLGYYLKHKLWQKNTMQFLQTAIRSRKVNKETKSSFSHLLELMHDEN